jgi:hypothetical protein
VSRSTVDTPRKNPRAKTICWPCSEGRHDDCDRKQGRTYALTAGHYYTRAHIGQETLLPCDCDPQHRMTYKEKR